MKSCVFIGHRGADVRLLPALMDRLQGLIPDENVLLFYVGRYGGFDRMVVDAVSEMKKDWMHSAVPNGSWCGAERQLCTVNSKRTSKEFPRQW